MDPRVDATEASAMKNMRLLANETMSICSLSKCPALAKVICDELDMEPPADKQELDGRVINLLFKVLTEVVEGKRIIALAAIRSDPNGKPGESQFIAAAGELLKIPYDNKAIRDELRREVRGVTDDDWERMLENNETDKKQRQLHAGLWLGQREVYAYKAAENRQHELLHALLAAAKVHVRRDSTSTLQDDLTTGRNDRKQPHTLPPGYIPRPDYHKRFNQLVAEKYKYIVLSGLPGIGKSSLADALTMLYMPKGKAAPIIEFVNEKPNSKNIESALTDCGVKIDLENFRREPERYLFMLLHDDNAPKFIIFDNLDNLENVSQLLPPRSKSTVVIACRAATHLDRQHAVIPVDWMTEDEAAPLVKSRIPVLSDEDANLLGASFYGYPLLIRHACALYACQPMPMSEFCATIQADVANLADRAETAENKSLLVVLQRLVELVKKDDQMAYDLLTCLTFVEGGCQVDRAFITGYLQEKTDGRITYVLQTEAIRTLICYSFIELTEGQAGESATFIMHNLTQALVRPLLASRAEEAAKIASRVYQQALNDCRDQTEQIADHWFSSILESGLSRLNDEFDSGMLSAADYYRKFMYARYIGGVTSRFQTLHKDLEKMYQYLDRNPDKRFGQIMIDFSKPDGFPLIRDYYAEYRPVDGDAVDILGYKLTVMDAAAKEVACANMRSEPVQGDTEWERILPPEEGVMMLIGSPEPGVPINPRSLGRL